MMLIYRFQSIPQADLWAAVTPYIKSVASMPTAVSAQETFDSVGDRPPQLDLTITRSNGNWIFPRTGEFHFRCDLGVFKILILPVQSFLQDMLAVLAFVSRNIAHGVHDIWSCKPNDPNDGSGFDAGLGLATKFFYSDQPLLLECGDAADFLAACLMRLEIQTRRVNIYDATYNGHIVIEAWDQTAARWVWLDPDFGVYLTNAAGKVLSGADVTAAQADPSVLTVVDVGRKRWMMPLWSYSRNFASQFTWRRDFMDLTPCGDQAGYRDMIHRFAPYTARWGLALDPVNSWRVLTATNLGVTCAPGFNPLP